MAVGLRQETALSAPALLPYFCLKCRMLHRRHTERRSRMGPYGLKSDCHSPSREYDFFVWV